jgi:hypothetical protein
LPVGESAAELLVLAALVALVDKLTGEQVMARWSPAQAVLDVDFRPWRAKLMTCTGKALDLHGQSS